MRIPVRLSLTWSGHFAAGRVPSRRKRAACLARYRVLMSSATATHGIRCGANLDTHTFRELARTMALDHHKWDAQVGDVAALAPFPVVLSKATWYELQSLSTALAHETLGIERELMGRPDLHARLGLSPRLVRALRSHPEASATPAAARIMRFDFHPTAEGWRVSEVNSDVCGGFTESSRFAELMALGAGDGIACGDAGAAWTDAVASCVSAGGLVVLLSAPGWVEDTQVVAHLAARLRTRGLEALLASPHHLRWVDGRARIDSDFRSAAVDAVIRFYQVEWIVDLPCTQSWMPLFQGGRTPVTNPGCVALTETKRLPLVWSELDASTATWRSLLPEARDPRDARGLLSGGWVLKPAFGNTGDDVAIRDCMPKRGWATSVAAALARPRRWVAQRRFASTPVESPQGPLHACIGVYVVDGRVSGAYGRLSPSPIINFAAMDVAVLVER
jgi:glutathionylspermidine synthase